MLLLSRIDLAKGIFQVLEVDSGFTLTSYGEWVTLASVIILALGLLLTLSLVITTVADILRWLLRTGYQLVLTLARQLVTVTSQDKQQNSSPQRANLAPNERENACWGLFLSGKVN